MRWVGLKKRILCLLICVAVIVSSSCGQKNTTEKEKHYGYRKYAGSGQDRVLREEFEVNGNVRTCSVYNAEGVWLKSYEVTYDAKTGFMSNEIVKTPGLYHETKYDNQGRKTTETKRVLEGDKSTDETTALSLESDDYWYDWMVDCDKVSFEIFSMLLMIDEFKYSEQTFQCRNCTELTTDYTYQDDSKTPKTIFTVSNDGKYSYYMERGDGDIILNAVYITDNTRFDEVYDANTKCGLLRWQTRNSDSTDLLTIDGEKRYDENGRLVYALVEYGDNKHEIAVDYSDTEYTVTETKWSSYEFGSAMEMSWKKVYHTDKTKLYYDSGNRLIRREDDEISEYTDENDRLDSAFEERYVTKYEYDDNGRKEEKYVEKNSLGQSFGEGVLVQAEYFDADDNLVFYQRFSEDELTLGNLEYESTVKIIEDPEIRGRIRVGTRTSYRAFSSETAEQTNTYELEMEANRQDYAIYIRESSPKWTEYRYEKYNPHREEDQLEVVTQGTFDSEGRLRVMESGLSSGRIHVYEYDEKGRQCAEYNRIQDLQERADEYYWEYWDADEKS